MSKKKQNSVFDSVKRLALEGLNDLIRVLMESVDDAMFDLSDKVDNDRERNMYFEAMREIRLKRDSLQQQFDQELHQCFDNFVNGKATGKNSNGEDELSLVELDEVEDNIAIGNMIKRARPHFEDDLFAVTERLKIVLRRDEISEDENPFDPKAICDSFHNASELLETDIQVKLILYKLFEKYVLSNLGHFYQELNEEFVTKGILPGFKPDQERMKQTTRFMSNRINKASPQQLSPATMPPGMMQTPTDGTGMPIITNGRGMPIADGNLFTTLQQAVGPAAGQPGAEVGTAAGGVGVVPAAGFVSALTSLQTTNIPTQPLTAIDPESLKASNQQQLLAFRQENQHQANAADNQTIDVVSMLFDFFFDDAALPAPIKVLIGRLQIPILKVAIIDKDFFNQKKHPARKLLDGISRASLGWGESHEDEQPLIDELEKIVNFLIAEFDEDIAVFDKALADLRKFLKAEVAAIKKAHESARKKEQNKDLQIQDAQQAAKALVDKLTHNRDLSFEVIDFLETTWTPVLFNAYLSLGESSNHWRNLKRISTTFVWTLIPKFSEEERVKIIKTIPALLRALSKGMSLIKINVKVQNRIFKMLAQEHAKIVKQTSKNIVTRENDTTVWPADSEEQLRAAAASIIDETNKENIEVSANEIAGIHVVEIDSEDGSTTADDSITVISAIPTNDVIKDLNQFAAGVKGGEIKVDEEIVLTSADVADFDSLVDQKKIDKFTRLARTTEIGAWVEFSGLKSSARVARLSWKSKVTGGLLFVNRQGQKVRSMTITGFATELRKGSAKCIETSSVFDRAIYSIMSKIPAPGQLNAQATS